MRRAQTVINEVLEVGIHAEPAEPLWKVHPREAAIELLAPELAGLDTRGRAFTHERVCSVADVVFGGKRLNVNDG